MDASRSKLLKAVMIVFLLMTVFGVFSPSPVIESVDVETPQIVEIPEGLEPSKNVNLEMMMFVQAASDDDGVYIENAMVNDNYRITFQCDGAGGGSVDVPYKYL